MFKKFYVVLMIALLAITGLSSKVVEAQEENQFVNVCDALRIREIFDESLRDSTEDLTVMAAIATLTPRYTVSTHNDLVSRNDLDPTESGHWGIRLNDQQAILIYANLIDESMGWDELFYAKQHALLFMGFTGVDEQFVKASGIQPPHAELTSEGLFELFGIQCNPETSLPTVCEIDIDESQTYIQVNASQSLIERTFGRDQVITRRAANYGLQGVLVDRTTALLWVPDPTTTGQDQQTGIRVSVLTAFLGQTESYWFSQEPQSLPGWDSWCGADE